MLKYAELTAEETKQESAGEEEHPGSANDTQTICSFAAD